MPQAAVIDTPQDVIAFLKAQHEQIRALFAEVRGAAGKEREDAFVRLRRLLAVHETAEEEVVHPRARRELQYGDAIVTRRLHEETGAKEVLAQLEKLDVDGPEFTEQLASLEHDVLAHAQAEEQEEFALLREELDDVQLQRMRRAVAFAEKVAPTRPHPGVTLAGENFLAGPFATMLDRARDAITGKRG
ncbi:MAG TPA: hemerythrin domain-containing protein [Jatrophihabitans sp.]|nr:hemerythrin domain-containing protein [Jatrophihabitans sp.]